MDALVITGALTIPRFSFSKPAPTLFLAAATALFLAGCSAARDPATEAPVELKAGQYRITMRGGGLAAGMPLADGPGAVDKSVCYSNPDDRETVSNLARQFLAMGPQCSHDPDDRVGNKVTGKISCPMDAERAPGGEFLTEYAGSISAEAIVLEGKVKFDNEQLLASASPEDRAEIEQGLKLLDSVSILVKAERTGDCS